MINEPVDDMSGMDKQALRTAYLISGYVQQTLTGREKIELDDWINQSRQNLKLFEELTDPRKVERFISVMQQMNKKGIRDKIDLRTGRYYLSRKPFAKLAVAASLVALVILAYLLSDKFNSPRNARLPIAAEAIEPGSARATLELSDGSSILLDHVPKGEVSKENGVLIDKPGDGLLNYTGDSTSKGGGTMFNSLATPRGGQYTVTLADGSRVWLNAASSIRYPVLFGDTIRKVQLTGEAYFEVAADRKRPFTVTMKGVTVNVLGTHFNIRSYADEPGIQVSLLEGTVNVSSKLKSATLRPGQQVNVDSTGKLDIRNTEMDEIIAWKEGYFRWKKNNIHDIMRQLSRWYDVDIVYQRDVGDEYFGGILSRKDSIGKILKIMEATSTLHFKKEDRTVTVMK